MFDDNTVVPEGTNGEETTQETPATPEETTAETESGEAAA